jgi:hypothetical protein
MKRGKRGQAATEFLMTYGWAVIVILVAFASLWVFGVFDKETPTRCDVGLPFGCPQAIITENSVILRVNTGEVASAEVTEFKVNDQICREITGELKAHSESRIICNGINVQEGEVAIADIKFSYTKVGSTLTHDVPSKVTGEATTIPTRCDEIKGVSGPYLIDPDGSGPVRPVETYCDMDTAGGGWTLCGKFDRDNNEQQKTTLDVGWGRAFVNENDLGFIERFTGKSASMDCRALVANGAEYMLNAGSDDGEPGWDLVSIIEIAPEIRANPVNLWNVNLEEPDDGTFTCDATTKIKTFNEDFTEVTSQFGCGLGNQRYVQSDDNTFFSQRARIGATFSNAAGNSATQACAITNSDTVFWCWPDNEGSSCAFGCCEKSIGTGCHWNTADESKDQAFHRYNLMFMR